MTAPEQTPEEKMKEAKEAEFYLHWATMIHVCTIDSVVKNIQDALSAAEARAKEAEKKYQDQCAGSMSKIEEIAHLRQERDALAIQMDQLMKRFGISERQACEVFLSEPSKAALSRLRREIFEEARLFVADRLRMSKMPDSPKVWSTRLHNAAIDDAASYVDKGLRARAGEGS